MSSEPEETEVTVKIEIMSDPINVMEMAMETVAADSPDVFPVHPGQLCRLCALPTPNMMFIYGEEGIKEELASKINKWLPISVSHKDSLPKQVCDTCIHQLKRSAKFSFSVLRAEYLLRELLTSQSFGTRHPVEEGGGTLSKRKPFRCEVCGRRYVSEISLQHHQSLLHGEEAVDGCGSSYQCEECGKVFSRKLSLESHLRSHSGLKPYSCKLCNKTFVHPSGLSSHIRRHKGDMPHSCKYCGKKFLQRSDRNDHERKHTGERPWTCDTCSKTFRTRAMWFEHCRIHRDERPFPCDFCGLAFRRSYALKNHRMIHTGEKNFVCKVCSHAFRVKQDLQKHERLKHQVKETPLVKKEDDVNFV